jgi:hypothetical protein
MQNFSNIAAPGMNAPVASLPFGLAVFAGSLNIGAKMNAFLGANIMGLLATNAWTSPPVWATPAHAQVCVPLSTVILLVTVISERLGTTYATTLLFMQ